MSDTRPLKAIGKDRTGASAISPVARESRRGHDRRGSRTSAASARWSATSRSCTGTACSFGFFARTCGRSRRGTRRRGDVPRERGRAAGVRGERPRDERAPVAPNERGDDRGRDREHVEQPASPSRLRHHQCPIRMLPPSIAVVSAASGVAPGCVSYTSLPRASRARRGSRPLSDCHHPAVVRPWP